MSYYSDVEITTSFVDFVLDMDADIEINNDSWSTCAVGEWASACTNIQNIDDLMTINWWRSQDGETEAHPCLLLGVSVIIHSKLNRGEYLTYGELQTAIKSQ